MKSRLLTTNYERFAAGEEFVYTVPEDKYITFDISTTPNFEDFTSDEVWLGYEYDTIEHYLQERYESAPCLFVRAWYRKGASVWLRLHQQCIGDGAEAVIVHNNSMIQVYPLIYQNDEGGDVTPEMKEWFEYSQPEYCQDGGIAAEYMISNGKLYDYSLHSCDIRDKYSY